MGILNSSVNFIIYRQDSLYQHHELVSSLLLCTLPKIFIAILIITPQFCGSHFSERISSVGQMPKNSFWVSQAFQRYGDYTASLFMGDVSLWVVMRLSVMILRNKRRGWKKSWLMLRRKQKCWKLFEENQKHSTSVPISLSMENLSSLTCSKYIFYFSCGLSLLTRIMAW